MIKQENNAAKPSAAEKNALRQRMQTYLAAQKNGTFNYRQVAHALAETSQTRQRAIALLLAEMAFDGDLIEVAPGKYKTPQRSLTATGTFVRRSNGKNSVITDQDGETIFVAERNSMHALNGDRVQIQVAARRRGIEPEAVVTAIIEEKPQTFIGTIQMQKQFAVLHTDSKYLATDIIIPRRNLKGAAGGDKAVVRITDWPDDQQSPIGTVEDILGKTGENNTEMHAILAEFGLPYSYPAAIEAAAAKIGPGITGDVVAKRLDLRGTTTFTIDPKDAKDFDDALSIKQLPDGNFEVGVHIADVTHYVQPDTAIDREARKRATSVYLVDRTIPMLPEHLSNGICSLRPDEDKLTFSTIFKMTPDGRVLDSRICRTVTRSVRRFTYEEAQQVIQTGKGDYAAEITALDKMAKKLREKRYENGAVDFDRAEVRFNIDDNGHPTDVCIKQSLDANKLIEEFMLLANRTVATAVASMGRKKHPKAFVYRVHDQPEPGRLTDLAAMCRTFGYKVRTTGTPRDINRSINKMLADVKGKGEENLLSIMAIRSMAKAAYTTDNIGHYGLGFDNYTHFTSPIRRYPDMMVHRLLERYLDGGRTANAEKLEEQCKHSSEMEQLASNAERSSIKYKQVEYMADRLGQVFSGVISGVTEWGLYVELDDNKCEGLVPVRDLEDDYYDFDERNFCLTGRRRGNRYRLGDTIKVQVARADTDRKQLDFVIVDDKNPARTLDSLTAKTAPKNHGGKKTQRRPATGRRRQSRR